jgi:hypothetical protein
MAFKILFMVLLSAAMAGCMTGTHCPGCDSCSSGSAFIPTSSDVSIVTTDSPCTATYEAHPEGDSGNIRVYIIVMRPGAGSCTVRVAFKSGTTDVSQVRFTAVTKANGCVLASDASPLQPVDAGTQ